MSASSRAAAGTPSAEERVDFRIQKMDCPDCVRRIETHLSGLEGVREVSGNPVSRRLRVAYAGGTVDPERLRHEVGRLGYVAADDRGEMEATAAWTGPDALRTYASATLFAAALLLRALGAEPLVAELPLAPLRLPGVLFLASAAVGGWNFFPAGLRSARTLSLDMNFLMTVAILGAAVLGEYLEASAIAFLFSTAELLETHAVDRARQSIRSLMDLSPREATVLRDGEEVRVDASEVRRGDRVLVRPGEQIPADGTVEEGRSAVDQSAITGESMPEEKAAGDEVFAGTRAVEGWLRVRVEKAAEDTTLAHIIHLVEEAETHKAPSERFVDRFARWYTPAVTAAAVVVAVAPPLLFGAPTGEWVIRGLTLLVIACPCALVISTPVAVVSGITSAARNGVLIKGGNHLERLGEVGVVAFDKTGTLTHGHPELAEVRTAPGVAEEELLGLAAAAEARSEHPVGRAVVEGVRERGVGIPDAEVRGFGSVTGKGVRARIGDREIRVGQPALFESVPRELEDALSELRGRGLTAVLAGPPDAPMGVLGVGDRARDAAREAVARLRSGGVRRVVMLTGDHRATAEAVAEELGIDEVHAELLPAEKVDRIRELESRHGAVAMVGDGVNDAPALAAASVGIAMGAAGSDAALETADVALMGDEIGKLPYLFQLSRRGRGVIRQNIGASVVLKAALAAGVPLGVVSLILAVVVGDMGASLGVTANSLRLARLRP
jgi:Cd2+/Zn2+-exporting ATPase